ncbi:MAG: quinolinate synthase NadA [Rickettsiales bacterium]|nr:MAG: quinolinate synthase NadA [Rickettsiales bacterium]
MKKHLIAQDIDPYINFEAEIHKLKKEHNAIILAHYYQDSEIQDIADFIGDSYELSKKAVGTDADVIVFCGVKFMAEAALILNPTKKILLPDLNAGCSLEDSCPPKQFEEFRKKHPNHVSVTYINCSAEVKALSDIIITSSNAEKIINSIPLDKEILFAPDKHLGNYLIKKTGRNMTLWNGSCVVHENFSERELIRLKTSYPTAKIIAHPECPSSLLEYANHIGSTSSLLNYVKENNGKEFIVLTEPSIIHQMHKLSPNSIFHDVPSLNKAGCSSCSQCPFMRLNTLEKVYLCMVNQSPAIKLEPNVMKRAKIALDRMLQGHI